MPSSIQLLLPVLVMLGGPRVGAQAPAPAPQAQQPQQQAVSDILRAPIEGREVRLRGRLMRGVGEGKYLFSDGSGTIRLDASQIQLPHDTKLSGQTTVEVIGEVGSGVFDAPSVQVHSVTLISP
ncbi:NirD/YgiW/YdeI family stress tolerance protein [Caldimonas brevitalea]|uniref:Uncharacterized protein n=1 Tax=Caldimonas brevitalea TaxID=413882 RepID=A0A0G3C081_9BURK|nr:NirD/YgiW/YdeI family stress tolerance protein [Caldimonas brevitalea]AKJ32190.1 hypothetical protein AAW51_5499 [Caldimonas brevitalea]